MRHALAGIVLTVGFCVAAAPALAASAIPARYQLRGHLPELGASPTTRFFQTDLAYEKFRADLGDANVFPTSTSLFMSFDKDLLVLYARGNDPLGGRCIGTTVVANAGGDTTTIALAWQSGTCGAPITAHHPFILMSLSRTASDGTSWTTSTRTICAMVETADTSACASLSSPSPSPAGSPTPVPTATPQFPTPSPSPTKPATPTAQTASPAAVVSPTSVPAPTRSAAAAASPTRAPDSPPSDVSLPAALVGAAVLLGVALIFLRRPRAPSGFRKR